MRMRVCTVMEGAAAVPMTVARPMPLPERSRCGAIVHFDGVHINKSGFASPQGYVLTHKPVFDRVFQRGILYYRNGFSPYKSHLGDAVTERTAAVYPGDHSLLSVLQISQFH